MESKSSVTEATVTLCLSSHSVESISFCVQTLAGLLSLALFFAMVWTIVFVYWHYVWMSTHVYNICFVVSSDSILVIETWHLNWSSTPFENIHYCFKKFRLSRQNVVSLIWARWAIFHTFGILDVLQFWNFWASSIQSCPPELPSWHRLVKAVVGKSLYLNVWLFIF